MATDKLDSDGSTLTVRVPIAIRRRGARKLIVSAEGEGSWPAPAHPRVDNTLLRAIVQAFRWKAQLDAGLYTTISDLAAAEKLNTSYVSHQLRLTLLAPDLVEAILDGRQPSVSQLQPLMRDMPADWQQQRVIAEGKV
jgi:hypothetical protein